MKHIVWFVLAFGLSGCASVNYAGLAREQRFEAVFPSHNFTRNFATVDEAYDFVNMAREKFSQASSKIPRQGLAARLEGPVPGKEGPVSLVCLIGDVQDARGWIDLSKSEKPLETVLKEAVSASLVFLVFYNDRGVSISSFFLADGWVYTNNSQIKRFEVLDNTYQADYPVGWGPKKAFSYLKGEVD
jgi:hypothetical protein